MIYPSILDRKYKEYEPFILEVGKKVDSTLENYCRENKGYVFASRIKTIESLAEKIETGRFKKWSDLDDLFACTVIIPTLSHEKNVIDFCKEVFTIVRAVKRGQNKKAPDIFRFDSTRLYAKLKNFDSIYSENQLSIYDIIFEIQIKSAFEHAWSVSTHDLVYKNSTIDWGRLRLAAQIKATVEQLDILILSFEQVSTIIQDNDYSEIKTKKKLGDEINILLKSGKIPDELTPKDMTRFCDNLYQLLKNSGKDDQDIKNNIMKIIKNKIQSTKKNQIPRSISLFQYLLAILIDHKIIEPSINKYYFHITEEFNLLYPSIQANSDSIFLYND